MKKDIPDEVRKEVLERDSFDGAPCCIYCGSPFALHLHHVKKRSQLGKHVPENLVTLCWKCHGELHDGDRKIQEYAEDYIRRNYSGK